MVAQYYAASMANSVTAACHAGRSCVRYRGYRLFTIQFADTNFGHGRGPLVVSPRSRRCASIFWRWIAPAFCAMIAPPSGVGFRRSHALTARTRPPPQKTLRTTVRTKAMRTSRPSERQYASSQRLDKRTSATSTARTRNRRCASGSTPSWAKADSELVPFANYDR